MFKYAQEFRLGMYGVLQLKPHGPIDADFAKASALALAMTSPDKSNAAKLKMIGKKRKARGYATMGDMRMVSL